MGIDVACCFNCKTVIPGKEEGPFKTPRGINTVLEQVADVLTALWILETPEVRAISIREGKQSL